jgi:hypothetical protein
VDFDVIDQRLIKYSVSGKYWRKNESVMIQVHQLYIDFKKAYDSDRREVFYNILTDFGIHRKPAGLIKMLLSKTCSTVHIGRYQSNNFPIQNGLKHGDTLSPLLFNFALNTPLGGSERTGRDEIEWDTPPFGLC